MNFTRPAIWSGESCLNDGILPLPPVMTLLRSASVLFCTAGEPSDFAPIFFPIGVLPLPSAPWHGVHFEPNVALASSAAHGSAAIRRSTTASVVMAFMFFLPSCSRAFGR